MRHTGAFVPLSVSAVPAGGGRPELYGRNPLPSDRTDAGSRGCASLIHMQKPKPRTGGQQRAIPSAAVSGMRAPQRSAKGRRMRTVPPRAQKRNEAAVCDKRIFFRPQPSREKIPRLRSFAVAAKVPVTSGRLATVKKELWNKRILLWRNKALQGKGHRSTRQWEALY